MGPIERFFTGFAAAIAAATAQDTGMPPSAPPAAQMEPSAAPTGPVPLPTPRPGDRAEPLIAAIAPPAEPAEAAPPPLPQPNPHAAAGNVSAGFTPLPDAAEVGAACRLSLAQLAVDATPEPPIVDGACGIPDPLEIHTIGLGAFAVALEPSALVDCSVASALSHWLEEDVQPAAHATLGQWVTGIRVAASYACRGRNNDPEAQLSEHAFGNAIDVSAFRLADGTWVEVQPFDDETAPAAQFLAEIRSDACGPFTTVLGPGVDLHDDHFHLDLAARGGNGQTLYCR